MSFESLDFAYHRGVDNKFTDTLNWTQILLILCKRLIKMLKHQAQTGFGTKSVLYVFDAVFTSSISILKAGA